MSDRRIKQNQNLLQRIFLVVCICTELTRTAAWVPQHNPLLNRQTRVSSRHSCRSLNAVVSGDSSSSNDYFSYLYDDPSFSSWLNSSTELEARTGDYDGGSGANDVEDDYSMPVLDASFLNVKPQQAYQEWVKPRKNTSPPQNEHSILVPQASLFKIHPEVAYRNWINGKR